MKYKNTRECIWCGGIASQLMYRGEYCLWDTFYLDEHNEVKIFICRDCGRVLFENHVHERKEEA